MGEYDGAHYFPYNFALSLLIVTTNVDVLCEYLSQECPLWETIKGYCCIVTTFKVNVVSPGRHPLQVEGAGRRQFQRRRPRGQDEHGVVAHSRA